MQSTDDGGEGIDPARFRVAIGALTGVIAGFCLGGPVFGIIGAAIGAGIEARS